MAKIEPYAPGSAEKTVVGVANYSKAKAGEAASVMAEGAGQIRNQIASNASQNLHQTFGLLDQVAGSIGGALGRAVARNQALGKAQQKMLAGVAANKLYYQAADAMDALHDDFTKDPAIQSNPANYPDKFKSLLNGDSGIGGVADKNGDRLDYQGVMDRINEDPNARANPAVIGELDSRMQALVNSSVSKARNWSLSAQTDNAVAAGEQVQQDVKEFAATISSDPRAAIGQMAQKTANALKFAQSDINAMGPKKTAEVQRGIVKTSTDSYVKSVAAQNANLTGADGKPDPLKALINIDVARRQLTNPKYFPHITADEYKSYDAQYDQAQHQQEVNLRTQFVNESGKLEGWIVDQNIKLDQNRNDPKLIQLVTDDIAQTIKDVKANAALDSKDLPTSVQNVYHEGRQVLLGKLDALQKHVNSNYQFQTSEANKAVVENRRIIAEGKAEQRHHEAQLNHQQVVERIARNEATAAQHAKEKEARDTALDEMNILAMQMNDPPNNAITNPQGLRNAAAALSANITANVQSGVLKGHTTSARNLQQQANGIVEKLASVNHNNGFFGLGAHDEIQNPYGKKAGAVAQREVLINAQIKRQQFGIALMVKQNQLSEDPKYHFDDATRIDFRDTAQAIVNKWVGSPPSPQADAERDFKLGQIPAMLAKKIATTKPTLVGGKRTDGPTPPAPHITPQEVLNGSATHAMPPTHAAPAAGFVSPADKDKAMQMFLKLGDHG